MRKFESSQKDESRAQSADSSNAYRQRRPFHCIWNIWYVLGLFLSEGLFQIKLFVILQSVNRETMKSMVFEATYKKLVILFNIGESVHFG